MSYNFAWSTNTIKSEWVYLFSLLIVDNRAVVLNIILTVNTCGYYDIQDSGIIALVIFINAPRFVPKIPPNSKLTVTHFLSWHISSVYMNLVVTMYENSCVDPCGH